MDGRTEKNPGMSSSGSDRSASRSRSPRRRQWQSRRDKGKNARNIKDELRDEVAKNAGLLDAKTQAFMDKREQRDDARWEFEKSEKEDSQEMRKVDLEVAKAKKLKEWRLVEAKLESEQICLDDLAEPKLELERAKVLSAKADAELKKLDFESLLAKSAAALKEEAKEEARKLDDRVEGLLWKDQNLMTGLIEYKNSSPDTRPFPNIRWLHRRWPGIEKAIQLCAKLTPLVFAGGFGLLATLAHLASMGVSWTNVLESMSLGFLIGSILGLMIWAALAFLRFVFRYKIVTKWTYKKEEISTCDAADLRPDAQALGALKHIKPMYVIAQFECFEKSRFGGLSSLYKSKHKISVELLSQIIHQAVAGPRADDAVVAERIKQAAAVCNSVALNRYSNVLTEDVVLNTCHVAFAWWKNSQRVRKRLPFAMAPSVGSQATAWVV